MEHAYKMVTTSEQRNPPPPKKSKLPWGRHKTFLKTLSKSHNFVTFVFFFNLMKVRVSVRIASALFSWAVVTISFPEPALPLSSERETDALE